MTESPHDARPTSISGICLEPPKSLHRQAGALLGKTGEESLVEFVYGTVSGAGFRLRRALPKNHKNIDWTPVFISSGA